MVYAVYENVGFLKLSIIFRITNFSEDLNVYTQLFKISMNNNYILYLNEVINQLFNSVNI